MKNLIILSLLLFSFFSLGATKKIGAFSELIVNSRIIVELIHAENHVVEIDDNPEIDPEKLSLNYRGDVLTISYTGNLIKGLPVRLKLFCNNLQGIKANSGSEVSMHKDFIVNGNRIRYTAFAGGKLNVHTQSKYTDVEVRQGGSVSVEGKTESLTAKVTTGGIITTSFLEAQDVVAEINLGGEIICTALKTIDAKVTSGGIISYIGNPEVNKKIVLGGTIENIQK